MDKRSGRVGDFLVLKTMDVVDGCGFDVLGVFWFGWCFWCFGGCGCIEVCWLLVLKTMDVVGVCGSLYFWLFFWFSGFCVLGVFEVFMMYATLFGFGFLVFWFLMFLWFLEFSCFLVFWVFEDFLVFLEINEFVK